MLLYHGTSAEAAESILKTGFQDTAHVWECSVPGKTYMVSVGDTYTKEEAIRFAIDAGQIAAAKSGSTKSDIVVFEFDIPDEYANGTLLPDISCPNMDDCWCIDNEELNNLIANATVKMKHHVVNNAYIPYLRPFYLANLNQDYMLIEDEQLRNICEKLNRTDMSWFFEICEEIMVT